MISKEILAKSTTNIKLMEKYCKDSDPLVKIALSKNKYLPARLVNELCKEDNVNIIYQLLETHPTRINLDGYLSDASGFKLKLALLTFSNSKIKETNSYKNRILFGDKEFLDETLKYQPSKDSKLRKSFIKYYYNK